MVEHVSQAKSYSGHSRECVCVCVCVRSVIVCLVMDSCQWRERAAGGAGWISVFALGQRQKTPLFFSAGDYKCEAEREKSEAD